MSEENPAPVRRGPARVHIYGGGITGLTAAHELARRGFRVRIYEPAQEYDELGRPEAGPPVTVDGSTNLAAGGRTRSQLLRVSKGAPGNFPGDDRLTTSDAYRYAYDFTGDWRGPGYSLRPDAIFEFLSQSYLHPGSAFPGVLLIRHRGLVAQVTPSRETAANKLHDIVTREFMWPTTLEPTLKLGIGPLTPDRVHTSGDEEDRFAETIGQPFPPLEDKDELMLEVVHFLPGEHRFRIIPSSSRHLFSTLEETPILDDAGSPTGRRLSDNLVPVRIRNLSTRAEDDAAPDAVRLTLRLWRYLSTCSERRKTECEGLSWREYLEGPEKQADAEDEDFRRRLRFASGLPESLDVDWGDARTLGNTFVQRYLDRVRPRERMDCTLNGPATPAWLRPWRNYLAKHLRVEFFRGELTRLAFEEGRLVPYATGTIGPEGGEQDEKPDMGAWVLFMLTEEPVDYHIVATDAFTAERVTEGLPRIGVIKGLHGFSTRTPANPRGTELEQRRPKRVLPGHVPWDRFQTRTGVQFFFSTSVRLVEGCLNLTDTPWALSVLNSDRYQALSPTLARDGYTSVLSVDIGRWYIHEQGVLQPSECSRHELAHEVWRQLREALGSALPEPGWYHVDHLLQFEMPPHAGSERAVANLAPYLVPRVGDWERRPGPEPWNPLAPPRPEGSPPKLPKGVWQASHGGYPVHWDKLLFAGPYLRTFSRTDSMEAANESARHAVNALLDHYVAHAGQGSETSRDAARTAPCGDDGPSSPAAPMTPVGEYCRIWDPERHELPELEPLRELDAKLYAAGLPHVWDVLQLEPLALPLLEAAEPADDARALRSFVERVRGPLEAMVDMV
ncbi:NAD(P)-binding protein [Pyxidicoccus parkwayensis]|uniref:NAD(P)-binding protein n=1 Tax=Pyxidicoccus parkwayensis TaxID=2813578 RepID=A0ABX7NX33_9BACT|nr:NAD(P)-binding protein [Pyxidicoccus parkwaysis]QSQ23444.1 NAD(P)-binding protein [Pyxidicoccus parkwaysis]